jgi:hypothetical protein
VHPIEPEKLRAFPTDADLPKDELNSTIDEHFVPLAKNTVPVNKAEYGAERKRLLAELKRVGFRPLPENIPAAKTAPAMLPLKLNEPVPFTTEDGVSVTLMKSRSAEGTAKRQVLVVITEAAREIPAKVREALQPPDEVFVLQPRGVGPSTWTRKNPPNYVERSHALLGRTVDGGRVHDIAALAKWLKSADSAQPVFVAGLGNDAILATYAALWEPDISGVIAVAPPMSHLENTAPQFLNILRVADVPTMFGLLGKPLQLRDAPEEVRNTVTGWYRAAGMAEQLLP